MEYREVIVVPESLMHARTHKYIDKIWKNGKWNYIYYDPKKKIDPSKVKQPVSNSKSTSTSKSSGSSGRKSSGRSKKTSTTKKETAKEQPTLKDQPEETSEEVREKGRKYVRTVLTTNGFGSKTIDSGAYIKEDSSGREFYYTRNKEGRLIKKYLK